MATGDHPRGRAGGPAPSLSLLHGFELCLGGAPVSVSSDVQRLLALLALRRRPQPRRSVAYTLWMDTLEDRATANLRTSLWRARSVSAELVSSAGGHLALGDGVHLDLDDVVAHARRLLSGGGELDDADALPDALSVDLLTDWTDDWVLVERERLRQLRLHALDALCARLSAEGRYAAAVDAGLAAVAAEPLRKSSHRALVRAHLAEGNPSEALRQYRVFASLLAEQIGTRPSPELEALVAPHRRVRDRHLSARPRL